MIYAKLFKGQGRKREAGMSDKEKMTAIIGIRVYPSWKRQMMKEAKERGKTLSQHVYELIEAGSEQVNKGSLLNKEMKKNG